VSDTPRGGPAAAAPPRAGAAGFFTGLSGAGKSTLAQAVAAAITEATARPVTLLDGDAVRTHLSSELGFSREHRDLNIHRIGWVAGEIVRHGGLALCAAIAPYDAARREVRRMIAPLGGFLLVHVSTSLDVCEERDVKGLYARARAGAVPAFTGISDPYETPSDADLTIDTARVPLEDACALVLERLRGDGYL
jgi:sulfate adenylyltransferase